MKTIGLLGGMSWESTALYYRLINEAVRERLGGLHSARIAMISVDFQEVETLQGQGDWDQAGIVLSKDARRIEAAGAHLLLICTNTMHKVAPAVESALRIPLLHIADATARRIQDLGMNTVGLLGTRFTMEQDFYRGRLEDRHGLRVIVPPEEDRDLVHRVIYEELCMGTIKESSRDAFLKVMDRMRQQGVEAVIEGCTEIVLLVKQEHTDIPLLDTTAIHAQEAVTAALA